MNCKNCERPLRTDYSFCSNCGAKIIRNRLTFRNLWYDFTERFFNVDNTFLKTIKYLFTQPETVILGYTQGIRKKFLNPVSFYAIALTLTGFLYYLIGEFFIDQLSMAWMPGGSETVGEDSFKTAVKNQTLISLISIPLYALVSKLLFLKKKNLNFTEHVVIYLYTSAQMSIVSFPLLLLLLVLGFNYYILTYVLIFVMIFYVAYCLKRIFKLTMTEIILKTLLFFIILVFLMILSGVVQLLFAYLQGGMEGIKKLATPK